MKLETHVRAGFRGSIVPIGQGASKEPVRLVCGRR